MAPRSAHHSRVARATILVAGLLCCWCIAGHAIGQSIPKATVVADDVIDARLPADPRWITGTLDNGVRYLVRTDDSRDGQLVLRLSADAGALSEAKDHPGAAFLTAMLLHAAAAESRAGKAVISLGEDLPAGTRATEPKAGQDAASFTVTLPIADDKAITLGLRNLAEIASGAGLDDPSILRNRPLVRTQRSAMVTRKDRLLAAVLPQIAPGSRVALHSALPGDAALCALENDALRAFHARRYAPSRLTLFAAGDAPVVSIVERIRREFGGLQPLADPDDEPIAEKIIAPDPHLRAAVAADPEMPHAVAEIVVVHEGSPPIRTLAAWRDSMIDRVAALILQRRLLSSMEQPGSPVRGVGVRIGPTPGDALVAVASVTGDPADWRRLIAEVASRTSRARLEPPSNDEMAATRQMILRTMADEASEVDAQGPLALVDAAWESTLSGNTLLSPSEAVAQSRQVLPTILAEEAQAALASRFRLSDAAFVLFMPDGAGTPPPLDVLAAALPAILPEPLGRDPERAVTEDAPPNAGDPIRGRINSLAVSAGTGVTSASLGNGVRFHHRRMTSAEPRVMIALTLTSPDPDPANPPPPIEATAALWATPASRTVSSEEMQRLLSGARIDLRSQVGPAQARIELSCPANSAPAAFRVIHLLLSEPRIEPAGFDRWRWSMAQRVRAQGADPAAAAFEAVSTASRTGGAGGAALAWNPSEADLEELDLETLQRWVDFILSRAPIEAAIVGDIERADALDVAATFLASLPPRGSPRERTDDPAQGRPVFTEQRIGMRGASAEAVVLIAVHGASDVKDGEALDVAAGILAARLSQRAATGAPPAKPVIVKHLAFGAAYDAPLLMAVGTTSPGLTSSLSEKMTHAFSSLATEGPIESELIKARGEAVEEFDRQAADSAWWARTLSQSASRGRDPGSLLDARERLIAVTREDVRDSLAAHDPAVCCGRPRLRIIVTPAESAAPPRNPE